MQFSGPGPPEPASATYRAPSGPNPIPRGLSRPSATTFSFPLPPAPWRAASAMACDGLLALLGAAVAAPPRAVTAASASRPTTAPARRAFLSMQQLPLLVPDCQNRAGAAPLPPTLMTPSETLPRDGTRATAAFCVVPE